MTAVAPAKGPEMVGQISELIYRGDLELAKAGKQELRSVITDPDFLRERIRCIRMQVEWKARSLRSSQDPAKKAEAERIKEDLIIFLRA